VAVTAHNQSFSLACRHHFYPEGFFFSSRSFESTHCANVMDFNIFGRTTNLADLC